MSNVYEKMSKAVGNMTAAVVFHKDDYVGRVVIKNKTAYCHLLGTKMQFGTVNGGGYDLWSAACAAAAEKAINAAKKEDREMDSYEKDFWLALAKDGGSSWDRALRDAGFEVEFAI